MLFCCASISMQCGGTKIAELHIRLLSHSFIASLFLAVLNEQVLSSALLVKYGSWLCFPLMPNARHTLSV